MTTVAPAPEQGQAHPSRTRWVALLALSLAVGIGAAITVVVVTGDDEATAAPLSQVQASCGDWMSSAQSDGLSDDQWCTDMFAWMSDQSGGSMMGSMMWQGPEQMRKTCRDWAAEERADSDAAGPQRCDALVEWMNGHMSSQGGNWMMQDR
jgi:hypothetical protein